jgi:hypothetical protein
MTLSASKNLVLIPAELSSDTVEIKWKFPFEIKLEHRTRKVGSTVTFQPRTIGDNELFEGRYTHTLMPGDVYEVRAFDRHFFGGSNITDGEKARHMLGEVVVHALQRASSLQSDFNEKVGGTFYRYNIATGSTPTHAIMEIGRDQPVADAAGFRTMPNPIMTVNSFDASIFHQLTTDSLDLGAGEREKLTQARFALITVSDAAGRWEQVERGFRTLQRKMTINLHTIDVQSLGEAPSETEAAMRFKLEVWDLNGQNWTLPPSQSFVFENHNVTLTPFSISSFVPNPVVVVGPRPVREIAGLGLHVQEFDPWPQEDEHASSMKFGRPQVIKVIPGEGSEDQPLNIVVKAAQEYDPFDTEQEVDVDLHVSVTVEHV